MAATFGWLCVETFDFLQLLISANAATFGWLCVETLILATLTNAQLSSHLRVAVC